MLGNSWVAAQFAASQEGLSSMELVYMFSAMRATCPALLILLDLIDLLYTEESFLPSPPPMVQIF
jgi:hypothetical protein